ncbi:hypothetical protein SLS62_004951 [Diatrype stigma]|uniref:Uncharacterized protein n=1 Tax=Diatrype stigma TaxID=117547 RepID=A0AAN9YSK1_9PEZI
MSSLGYTDAEWDARVKKMAKKGVVLQKFDESWTYDKDYPKIPSTPFRKEKAEVSDGAERKVDNSEFKAIFAAAAADEGKGKGKAQDNPADKRKTS